MKLQDKFIMLRKKQGWSQEDLADKLGVSRQAVSRWENGSALPDAQNILQISRLFQVTADYLLNDDFESDADIPIVQEVNQKCDELVLSKKKQYLISAIAFAFVALYWFLVAVPSASNSKLGVFYTIPGIICLGAAGLRFYWYLKK